MTYIIESDELYHHGILGQKWGIRRYQNEDGTLTRAGKLRYKKDERFRNKIDRKNIQRDLTSKGYSKSVARSASKKMLRGMSEEEAVARVKNARDVAKTALISVGGVAAATIPAIFGATYLSNLAGNYVNQTLTKYKDTKATIEAMQEKMKGEWVAPNIYRGESSFKLDNGERVKNSYSIKIG